MGKSSFPVLLIAPINRKLSDKLDVLLPENVYRKETQVWQI